MREAIPAAALLVILVLLVNPMHFWMPSGAHMLMLGVLAVIVGVILVFLMREHGGDEREAAHRAFAGRIAFLMGALVLLSGILVEGLGHSVNPWLAAALAAMVCGKLIARAYAARRL